MNEWFDYLKVGTGDASGNLLEERLLDFDELGRLGDVEDLLDLAQEHDLQQQQHRRLVISC